MGLGTDQVILPNRALRQQQIRARERRIRLQRSPQTLLGGGPAVAGNPQLRPGKRDWRFGTRTTSGFEARLRFVKPPHVDQKGDKIKNRRQMIRRAL
jgi:hypothetical protein